MQPKYRVLVVDDDPQISSIIRDILEGCNRYEITLCATGYEALDCVKSAPADCVVLDLCLPGINGFRTLRLMREIQPDIAVIFISAFVEQLRQQLDEHTIPGVRGCIGKPFPIDELKELVLSAVAVGNETE